MEEGQSEGQKGQSQHLEELGLKEGMGDSEGRAERRNILPRKGIFGARDRSVRVQEEVQKE